MKSLSVCLLCYIISNCCQYELICKDFFVIFALQYMNLCWTNQLLRNWAGCRRKLPFYGNLKSHERFGCTFRGKIWRVHCVGWKWVVACVMTCHGAHLAVPWRQPAVTSLNNRCDYDKRKDTIADWKEHGATWLITAWQKDPRDFCAFHWTSWHISVSRTTGPLWGNPLVTSRLPSERACMAELWTHWWINSRAAGDFWHRGVHMMSL